MARVIRFVLSVGLLCIGFSTGQSAWGFNFFDLYVVAHADDWQIFQSPNTFSDVKAGDRVLIIQASASDAGRTDGYWQAREEAAKASVRWMVGNAAETSAHITVCSVVRCHSILTWSYGPVTVAFLRVPDGGGVGSGACGTFGNGTAAYGCRSLSQLRDRGRVLPAVDNSTAYTSWPDLYGTILRLPQQFGFPFSSATWINAPEFDRSRNPNDHPDHLAIGDAARTLHLQQPGWHFAYFVGDSLVKRPANLNQAMHDIKMGLYFSYYTKLVDIMGSTVNEVCSFESGFVDTLWRTYFRTF